MNIANADRIADGRMYAVYVEWRSNNPSDDLMTALFDVEFEDELGATPQGGAAPHLGVAGAGNETTGRLIGWLAKVLAEHPDQRREVERDRSLLFPAIEETLRFETTGPHLARWLTRDFEAYGQTVPAAAPYCCSSGRPTGTRDGSRTPTRSTSTAPTAISRSARACTTAAARTWPGLRAASRSTNC
jgi:cytochrome P450